MPQRRSPFYLSVAAVLVLVIGLIGTSALFIGLRRLEHDKVDLDFQQRANIRILAIQRQLDETVQVLMVLNRMFTTFEPVSREQFQAFTQPLLQRHPYVQAFNFHRYIGAAARPAYEARMRQHYPGFGMTQLKEGMLVPAQVQERHLVVDYIEPMCGNEVALGLDVSPNKELLEAVQHATDTGTAVSSGLLTLAQGGGRERGFLVVMPVYRHGAELDDVASRRRAVIGDTAAVFNAAHLIGDLLGAQGLLNDERISISVFAGGELDERNLAFRKGGAPQEEAGASLLPPWIFHDRPSSIQYDFDVAGKPWRMVASMQPAFFTERHGGSLNGLIAGILLSLMTAAYVQALSSRSRRVHKLVDLRTAELRHANELLTEDIAARKRAEAGLTLRQRAIDASANAVIITSSVPPAYPIEYVNPAFERITGYRAAEVIGRSSSLMWADDLEQPEISEIRAAAREKRESHSVLRVYAKDGRLIWGDVYIAPVRDESGEVNHFVVALYDVTDIKRYQAELEFHANRDALTGLANRKMLLDRVGYASVSAERYGQTSWLLFLNLDRFKFVNDTLGHRNGDQLLKCIAERLQQAVHETDTVARLSADEFVMLLTERGDEYLSPAIIDHIMHAVARPIVLEGYEFVMSCSIGVAVCPVDAVDPDALIKHVGVAMDRAKELGRNNFQFYTTEMNDRALERLRIEVDLRNALERDEFVLHYQPQVELRTGRILGMEALIRWRHPDQGMLAPAQFIGLAEELGLIVPLGNWVLHTVCRKIAAWQLAGLGPVRIAVNLSARQFYQQDLVASIKAILDETGIPPSLLELELTESMMMHDVEHAAGILRQLKAVGVHLAIDDFGTGYSSLAYLKRFPIDVLKIDQSFVRDITVDADDAAIVLSVISLAHSLRLKVTAEGVENAEQLAYLRRHGCDYVQGYYFSRPLDENACLAVLMDEGRAAPLAACAAG